MLLIETLTIALSSVTDEEINSLISGFKKPSSRMEKVGVLTPDLRKLYALAVRYVDESAVAGENHKNVFAAADKSLLEEPVDVKAAREKSSVAQKRVEEVRQIFWICVREELGFSEEDNLSLGPDWQVFAPPLCLECEKRHGKKEGGLDLGNLLLDTLLGGRTSARIGNA